jgi:hypothetical protein
MGLVFIRGAGDIGDSVVESEGVLKWVINDQLLESLLRVCLSFVNKMHSIGCLDRNSVSEGTILAKWLIYTAFIIQEETAVMH